MKNLNLKTNIFLLTLIVFGSFIILSQTTLAAECNIEGSPWLAGVGVKDGLLIPCGCIDSEIDPVVNEDGSTTGSGTPCGLTEALQVVINFSNLILAVTGSAALLMFTIGGVMFIIAAGNQERVQKGKAVIQAAVIGIIIILGAWLMVNTIIGALTKGQVGGTSFIFGNQSWTEEPVVNQ